MKTSRWWVIVIVAVMLSFAWLENSVAGNDKYLTCSYANQSEIEIRGTIYCVDQTTANLHFLYHAAFVIAALGVLSYLVMRWWRSRGGAGG